MVNWLLDRKDESGWGGREKKRGKRRNKQRVVAKHCSEYTQNTPFVPFAPAIPINTSLKRIMIILQYQMNVPSKEASTGLSETTDQHWQDSGNATSKSKDIDIRQDHKNWNNRKSPNKHIGQKQAYNMETRKRVTRERTKISPSSI